MTDKWIRGNGGSKAVKVSVISELKELLGGHFLANGKYRIFDFFINFLTSSSPPSAPPLPPRGSG